MSTVSAMIIKRVKDIHGEEYNIKHWVDLHDDCEDTYVIGVYKVINGKDNWCTSYLESYTDLNDSIQRYNYIVDNFKELYENDRVRG